MATVRPAAAAVLFAAGLATQTAAAAPDNPTERGQAAAAQVVPAPLSPEEEARAEAAVAAREQAVQRAFDPAFREALKRAPEALLDPGDSTTDLVYTPVAPCRVLDTRSAGGPLAAGTQRNIRVAGALAGQGGEANCGVPFGPATAVVLNFVAVTPQGPGDLRAWAFGGAAPNASVLNYAAVAGLNIANGVVVPICNPGAASCGADLVLQADASATQVVADVLGYFRNLRLPLFQAANWLFQPVPPLGSPAAQLASLSFTATLPSVVRLRARGYCNMMGIAGDSDEIHLAIGTDAADAFNTGPNPTSNWGVMLVPAGAPLVRHVSAFTAERFVSVAAGATLTYGVFARHQAGVRTDDCSGTLFLETSF
jgi:hypothetical protein